VGYKAFKLATSGFKLAELFAEYVLSEEFLQANSKTENRNPKSEAQNPKPGIRNPEPEIRNPKPET
jgi:hypothetical protein